MPAPPCEVIMGKPYFFFWKGKELTGIAISHRRGKVTFRTARNTLSVPENAVLCQRVANPDAVLELFREWITAEALASPGEFGSVMHDFEMESLRERAKRKARDLGIIWRDEYLPIPYTPPIKPTGDQP